MEDAKLGAVKASGERRNSDPPSTARGGRWCRADHRKPRGERRAGSLVAGTFPSWPSRTRYSFCRLPAAPDPRASALQHPRVIFTLFPGVSVESCGKKPKHFCRSPTQPGRPSRVSLLVRGFPHEHPLKVLEGFISSHGVALACPVLSRRQQEQRQPRPGLHHVPAPSRLQEARPSGRSS